MKILLLPQTERCVASPGKIAAGMRDPFGVMIKIFACAPV
jgi:hypothetical protein